MKPVTLETNELAF